MLEQGHLNGPEARGLPRQAERGGGRALRGGGARQGHRTFERGLTLRQVAPQVLERVLLQR